MYSTDYIIQTVLFTSILLTISKFTLIKGF